jgi:hypothetical protein
MNRFIPTTLLLAAMAAATGCMSPPKGLDLALTRPSADSKYLVTLQPPAKPAAINQLHAWQVRLTSPSGVPVANARIQVDGGMPQHGHGLPTRPQVTRELPGGGYLIEGMKQHDRLVGDQARHRRSRRRRPGDLQHRRRRAWRAPLSFPAGPP